MSGKKGFTGNTHLRLSPKLHEAAAFAAMAEGLSINEFMCVAVAKRVRAVARRDMRVKLTLQMVEEKYQAPEPDEAAESEAQPTGTEGQ